MFREGFDYVAITFDLQLFADVVVPSNAETNMMTTQSPEIDVAFQKANDQKFLEIHKEALVFEQYVGSVNLPANSGNTVRFPKKHRITPKNTLLTEGKTPDPNKIQISAVTATVEQHGDYVMFTGVALGTSIYDLMNLARQGQAYESAEVKNALIRDRNNDKARAEHLNEINKTREEFFAQQDQIKDQMKKYRDMKFPTLEIKR